MVSQAEIDRLRLEADTIMTRYQQVDEALTQARSESGEHWEAGELTVTLETPRGESIRVALEFEAALADNAEARYNRAKELEAELERKKQIVGQLAPLPADPVAYLICYHLDAVNRLGVKPRGFPWFSRWCRAATRHDSQLRLHDSGVRHSQRVQKVVYSPLGASSQLRRRCHEL